MGCERGRRCRRDRRMAVAVAAVTALAGAGAACGSGGSDRTGAGTTTPALSVDQDRSAATRILLSSADVPGLMPANPPEFDRLYAQCGADPLLPGGDDPRRAPPVGFLKDETAEAKRLQTTAVASYAVLAPTEEAAKVAVATLHSPEFRTCLERELRAAVNNLAGRQVVSSATTAELATPVLGDETLAFRTTLMAPGGVYQSFALTTVRKGRTLASVTTGRLGAVVFPDDERIRLLRLMAGRLS